MSISDQLIKKVRPEIRQRIIDSAEALLTEGIDNPTNDQVREHLGGGSLSHISPVMRHWRESRKTQHEIILEMPPELHRVIERSIAKVWSEANRLVTDSIQQIQHKARQAVATASEERDDALQEIIALERKVEQQMQSIDQSTTQRQQLKAQIIEHELRQAQLTSKTTLLSEWLNDRDAQLQELNAKLEQAVSDNKDLQQELINIARDYPHGTWKGAPKDTTARTRTMSG